jgi:uncharacterized repeat protein (TIGR03837 family)
VLSAPRRCDIFCRVIDNYGDIGVTWRLARQLVAEHHWQVRLVVDDVAALRSIQADAEVAKPQKGRAVPDIYAWKRPPDADFGFSIPPDLGEEVDVVVEAFGCALPSAYVAAMATGAKPPLWFNLEYLSAEAWVGAHHMLASPHPQLGLVKHFYFPGFDESTGGLIREHSLSLPISTRPTDYSDYSALRVFLFGYESPGVLGVAGAMATSANVAKICCASGPLAARLSVAWPGRIDVRAFVPQSAFDRLLAEFDVLLVRGEDSFVRAQWTGKPFIWQIYPQDDGAHWVKLDAFLGRYCDGLAEPAASALRNLSYAVNGRDLPWTAEQLWADFERALPMIGPHALAWTERLFTQSDLASRFIAEVEKNLKSP